MRAGITTTILKSRYVYYIATVLLGLIIIFSLSTVSYAASNGSSQKASDSASEEGQTGPSDADVQNATCTGADLRFTSDPSGDACTFAGMDADEKLNKIVSEVINFFSIIIGIIAVLMIIVGGFRYIISGGDSGNVTTAKNTILYAIIGLLVVVFAQFIVKFILGKAVDIAS